MEKNMTRLHCLANELSQILDLESSMETMLAIFMVKLNQFMDSQRSSIFLFEPLKQQLTTYSSLDLEKNEIRLPKSDGVAGWVFENRLPAIVNDTAADSRFYCGVDDLTGFHTGNLICCPLINDKKHCSGTLQSLNKTIGDFTTDDLELLELTACFVVVAINNNRRYNEIRTTNIARGKVIQHIINKIGKSSRSKNL
ncbi:MAG: GAF domain-containing protein [Desulfobacterales bacterium]